MGAGNVSLAYIRWSHLPDRAFRLLTYMALVSMDTDVPPRYFGGYPALARALGRETSDTFDRATASTAERKARKADMEAVRIGVGPLLEVAVIVVDRPEAPGRGPEFALLLDERSRRTLPTVQASPDDLGGVGGETLETNRGRRELGTQEEQHSALVSSSLAAVDEIVEKRITYEIASQILEKLPDLGVPDLDHSARWGGLFRRAAREGLLEEAGARRSTTVTRRASLVRVWRGTAAARTGGAA